MFTEEDIDRLFTYHAPKGDQVERYAKIRDAFRQVAHLVLHSTPTSPEQTIAIRKLMDANMAANLSIAVNE